MASQIQKLKSEFEAFKKEVINILEEINSYLHEKDTLGPERIKTERIKGLINSLKEETKNEG